MLSQARGRETAAAQALVRSEGAEAAGRTTLEAIRARVDSAAERRAVAERELAGDAQKVTGAERDVVDIETDLDRITEAAAAAETVLEEARSRADAQREVVAAAASHLAAASARVDALREVSELFADRADVVELIRPLIEDSNGDKSRAADAATDARARFTAMETEAERLWRDVAIHDEELRRLDALMAGAAERLAGRRRRHESRQVELATLDDELARARDALAEAERKITEERAAIPAHRAALDEAKGETADRESALSEARAAFARADRDSVNLELTARTLQERSLAAELRLEEAEGGIADAEIALAGLADLRTRLITARDRARAISACAAEAASKAREWSIDASETERRQVVRSRDAAQRLESMRERERDLTEKIEVLARRRNEDEVRKAETQTRLEALGERAMDEWGMSIDALLEIESFPEDADETGARKRVEALDREMRRLGPVNPRAHEEYAELAEREEFLTEQREDLRASKRDLMKVVGEVDETIVEVFTTAFEDVAAQFESVFERMFPGGQGRLKLTDPGDALGSGVEIEARPPGKNVKKLSLLSGGERSLVALGFLFAIFRARPSPFYLLDEVEAALDDINLQRFLGLVGELEERAQILIVTHQKRTMEAGDVLYGVSMAKDGVSTVVAKRLTDLELIPSSR
jgi:chromosome segregation protein